MKNKKTVAFLINEIDGPYFQLLTKGVIDASKSHDLNLIILPGKILNSPNQYEYNFNVVYEFINKKAIDAVIVSSGTLLKYVTLKDMEVFLKKFKGIPTVNISLPIGNSVLVNNSAGLKNVINHLIRKHNKRKIAFVTGADQHAEAEERFKVYQDALKENSIELRRELIIKGDFTYNSAYVAVNGFLNKNIEFDAIVCSNDEMALATLKVLNERGIRVPQDVAVTGFDNVEESLIANLTTVNQPIYKLGVSAVECVINLLNAKSSNQNISLDTNMVMRESCGCANYELKNIENTNGEPLSKLLIEQIRQTDISSNVVPIYEIFELCIKELSDGLPCSDTTYDKLKELISHANITNEGFIVLHRDIVKLRKVLLESNKNVKSCFIEECCFNLTSILIEYQYKISARKTITYLESSHNLRDVLLTMLASLNDPQVQLENLFSKLHDMGINNCYIFGYLKEIEMSKYEVFKKPKELKLMNSLTSFSRLNIGEILVSSDQIFSQLPNTRSTYLMYPLFFHNQQLGLVLFEYDDTILYDNSVFESLVVEISCAIKLSMLLSAHKQIEDKLKSALQELEDYNERLNFISLTDELTGLYNRRGFLNLAQKSLELSQKMRKPGYCFFADMDGLKKINDTYGHDEGDFAIKAMAEILKKTFRASDIIARLGGDEFTILAIGNLDEKQIKKRLNELTKDFNSSSNKPYELSITVGTVNFEYDPDLTIDVLMDRADENLYKYKNSRKINSGRR